MNLTAQEAYEFGLLPLAIWREARNQGYQGMLAVAWSIKNRVIKPCWWGVSFPTVILKKWQYSSFNWNDPNDVQFPKGNEPDWQDALRAATDVFTNSVPDPTMGADSYFDKSLDSNPPDWSKTAVHTCDIGAFHFYRTQ